MRKKLSMMRRWCWHALLMAAGLCSAGAGVSQEDSSKAYRPTHNWALAPIADVSPPVLTADDQRWVRTPIDAFVLAQLREKGLSPSAEADRRTLIRRLYFDLIGLPPPPEVVEAFVNDEDPHAYPRLVDELLASPRYGERWARHWLDLVHYADTHGYDKDKVRPHAWPYRDYVIAAFNGDTPYGRFIQQQIAGDVLWPDDAGSVAATGFLAAGPWDFVGHVELGDNQPDKQIVRNLDRDDMVAVTMNSFVSMTVQCARCHDHKLDPIDQVDYYSLQAVFAGVDRADRPYPADAALVQQRQQLSARKQDITARQKALAEQLQKHGGDELRAIDQQISALSAGEPKRPEYGYHSRVEARQDGMKWVQVDLEQSLAIDRVVLIGAHDDFKGIGAGFGFPLRYRVEASDDPTFASNVVLLDDQTATDLSNPGVGPVTIEVRDVKARYVRVTATRLAPRANDYIFALGELAVHAGSRGNVALNGPVTALDSIEAPARWRRQNLVDGIYFGPDAASRDKLQQLQTQRQQLVVTLVGEAGVAEQQRLKQDAAETERALAALPAAPMVFAAATHFEKRGNFTPTLGKTRPIYLLHRGDERQPRQQVGPGALSAVAWLPSRFTAAGDDEGARRVARARWISDPRNPLTWRSVVNRMWQYHFGTGIVETTSDFGQMGSPPTHPQLLDWLATWFREDGNQSLKSLHRLICNSAVYRQSSEHDPAKAAIDADNRYLWRFNRRRLEAEPLRDSVLMMAAKLDLTMGGPGFFAFEFKDDHSPHYGYEAHDPDARASWRRAIYRFVVRSVPDPFFATLDCADPSLMVERRTTTVTPLQSLSLLNNPFMVRMSEHFASRLAAATNDPRAQIDLAYMLAFARPPRDNERELLLKLAADHGLASVCRLIFNANEFIFID